MAGSGARGAGPAPRTPPPLRRQWRSAASPRAPRPGARRRRRRQRCRATGLAPARAPRGGGRWTRHRSGARLGLSRAAAEREDRRCSHRFFHDGRFLKRLPPSLCAVLGGARRNRCNVTGHLWQKRRAPRGRTRRRARGGGAAGSVPTCSSSPSRCQLSRCRALLSDPRQRNAQELNRAFLEGQWGSVGKRGPGCSFGQAKLDAVKSPSAGCPGRCSRQGLCPCQDRPGLRPSFLLISLYAKSEI